MKKIIALLFTAAIFAGYASSVTLNANYQIVLPDRYDNPGTEKYLMDAAAKLQSVIRESCGWQLPICRESATKPEQPGIFIGNTAKIREHDFKPETFSDFNCVIVTRDANIFLAGNDRHCGNSQKVGHYNRYILGSVKAMVVFMEDYLGTRFLLPGEVGTAVSSGFKNMNVQLTREIKPMLNYATGRHQELIYDYANNNFGRGYYHTYGGHSYYDAVPKAKYAKNHPEYFILAGGERDSAANHLCISNPQVQELIYQNVLERLDAGAETAELAQTDGYRACQCDDCRKFGNTSDPGEKLWILHRGMAERLLKDRPGKKVMIIAYGPTVNPPKAFNSFPDNVVIELCGYTPEAFAAWQKVKVAGGFTTYIYNWGHYLMPGMAPKRTPEYCAAQIRLFAANNVKGIYRCGFGENMGLEGPSYYVYGKMLDNPELNTAALLKEFYQGAFAEAAGPMTEFYRTLYERLRVFSTLQTAAASPPNPRILLAYIYSPDVLDMLENNLARAEKLAAQPKIKKRLELVRMEFDYTKNLAAIVHLYNGYRTNPTQANFDQLAIAIDARNAMIESYYNAKGQMEPLPGWPEIQLFSNPAKDKLKLNGSNSAILGAPYTWNTTVLRQSNILPGTGKKTLSIIKASGEISTDNFESGAWSKAEWHPLNGIQMGSIKEQTRFKVIYDAQHIYFGLETELPASQQFNAAGRDGKCWGQDCLELVIDPFGSREKYFHLIINPVEKSNYDSAFGLIDDPLNPLYNQADRSWNGTWQYFNKRIGDKWFAMFKIPFADFGVTTPEKGTNWTLNVGRESFRTKHPELSLWSPNFETMSFHDRESFGEAIFE